MINIKFEILHEEYITSQSTLLRAQQFPVFFITFTLVENPVYLIKKKCFSNLLFVFRLLEKKFNRCKTQNIGPLIGVSVNCLSAFWNMFYEDFAGEKRFVVL